LEPRPPFDEAPGAASWATIVLHVFGAALAGERALDRLGLIADLPELQHG